jgi:anaerobic magnesium-protoporphyrin IX monomethyl ester cyclase
MSYRVLLNNPPVFQVVEAWYDTPLFGRQGLAYLAAYLREHTAFEVRIVDSKFERLDFQQTLDRIVEFDPHVVGFTAFTNEIKPAAHMACMTKASLPNAATVIGGVHMTALPEETMSEFSTFDFGVHGEGEITFLELCRALSEGGRATGIDGLSHREDGAVVVEKFRERILDLDSIPAPAWDLLPPAHTYYIQTARGCPFACKFCMNPNGKFVRRKSVEKVIRELQLVLDRYQPEMIWYSDEIFTVDVERTKELLRAKIEAGIPARIEWAATTHVRFVDDELFGLMKTSNVSVVGFGIETGDEEALRRIGKGTNVEMMKRAREGAQRAGVPISTYCILGQPDETLGSMSKTIALTAKLNPEFPVFGIMVPYPGTEVARLAARGEAGYTLLSTDWNDYNKQIGGALAFAGLPRRAIEILQLYAYVRVFVTNFRFPDLLRFAWQFRSAGWSVVKKIASGFRKTAAQTSDQGPRTPAASSIEAAAGSWRSYQLSELSRAKRTRSRPGNQPSGS